MNDLACIDAVERVTEYLERALSDDGARELRLHLERCPGCSEYLEQLRWLAGGLSGLRGDDELPARLRARIVTAIREP